MSDNIQNFISNYTASDESCIRFDWNGKHAEEFVDRNIEFRRDVRKLVLTQLPTTPIELVRNLFLADTRCSREAWGISLEVRHLAEELLRRGGPDYVDNYLEGKFQGTDASMTTSAFNIDLPLAQSMLTAVRERLRNLPDSTKVDLWRKGEVVFERWVKGCEQRALEGK